jgi:2-succinyl-5-enolpyruvyl-6-hydroxy-3-cyclohexene-1-carboxylate synthase
MAGVEVENCIDTKAMRSKNGALVVHLMEALLKRGVQEFVLCPGARNSPFVQLFEKGLIQCQKWYFFEERSAAFFALGRARFLNAPVAVITTSGTAVGELLPAMMEAYYSGVPLIALSADRPRLMRGTAAPQVVDQVGIFTSFISFQEDLAAEERSHIHLWDGRHPAHVNICIEEPLKEERFNMTSPLIADRFEKLPLQRSSLGILHNFFNEHEKLLVIVGSLKKEDREYVKKFVENLKAPVVLEAHSGLREESSLQNFIYCGERLPSDVQAVLRLGGVPTVRMWRDLEERAIAVLSISTLPFTGLSHGKIVQIEYQELQDIYISSVSYQLVQEKEYEPLSWEEQFFKEISSAISENAVVYLGNSLPIRYWDRFAVREKKHPHVFTNRGANGIDGQLSTFFGLCNEDLLNIGIFGDLTCLYDLAAFWCLKDLQNKDILIVVVNNGGGKIFEKMYQEKAMQNAHTLNFSSMALFWGINYCLFQDLPLNLDCLKGHWLIEVRGQ